MTALKSIREHPIRRKYDFNNASSICMCCIPNERYLRGEHTPDLKIDLESTWWAESTILQNGRRREIPK